MSYFKEFLIIIYIYWYSVAKLNSKNDKSCDKCLNQVFLPIFCFGKDNESDQNPMHTFVYIGGWRTVVRWRRHLHTKVCMNSGLKWDLLPSHRNTSSPQNIHPARRFAPLPSYTTQADDFQNRLPALSIYD